MKLLASVETESKYEAEWAAEADRRSDDLLSGGFRRSAATRSATRGLEADTISAGLNSSTTDHSMNEDVAVLRPLSDLSTR